MIIDEFTIDNPILLTATGVTIEAEIAQLEKLRKGLQPWLRSEVRERIELKLGDLRAELRKARAGMPPDFRRF